MRTKVGTRQWSQQCARCHGNGQPMQAVPVNWDVVSLNQSSERRLVEKTDRALIDLLETME